MASWQNGVIEVVPAVRRLGLWNVGCWDHLDMEFLPGLNLITATDYGLGKTTILRAIMKAAMPSSQFGYRLDRSLWSESGSITVEFFSSTVCLDIDLLASVPESSPYCSCGQKMLQALRYYLHNVPPQMSLLMEDEVTGMLDIDARREAADLLNNARCQVICLNARSSDMPSRLPSARIYTCFSDHPDGRPEIRLLQPGEARRP